MTLMRKKITSIILLSFLLGLSCSMISCQSSSDKQKPASGSTASGPAATTAGSQQPDQTAPAAAGTDSKMLDHPVLLEKKRGNGTNPNAPMMKTIIANTSDQKGLGTNPGADPNLLKANELYRAGVKKAQDGDQAGALEAFTQSINVMKQPGTYMKRGFVYFVDQQYQLALDDMNEALKLMPNLVMAYFGRGVTRFEMQDFKGAEEDLKKFMERDKTNAMAFNYLAGCRFMNKDYKGALENYDMVVKLDPKYPDIYTNRGMMRHYLNDLPGAIEDYNKAIELNPEKATAYNNRGAAKLNQKDFKGALADFDKAISLKQDYADAFDNRGKVKAQPR
jgi:tetratricopeptide (TPR) repeat protein